MAQMLLWCRNLRTPLYLFLILSACDGRDTLPTADSPAPAATLIAAEASSGIPYGVADLWGSSGFRWGPAPFTSSNNFTYATTIVSQLATARALGHKLILNMTGGSHERYKTDGKFDMAKWIAVMNTYNTPAIQAAVRDAVADGTVIMNSVMDEPSVKDWGGVMTKPMLDAMAQYVKNMFPTLPVGVVVRWDWRTDEHYQVMDAMLAQYQWNKGSVTAYRDNVLGAARRDGMAVVFSINMLNGGINSWTTKDCPIPLTGGFGTYSPACQMTPEQVREWGQILGIAGCAMNMWRFDDAFMANPENQQAFRDVATRLASIPPKPCRRGTPAGGPPSNSRPTAAFVPPECRVSLPCQFSDASSDSDGYIVAWSWDFGDGSSSVAQNPTVTFTTAGSYDVMLTVNDNQGSTGSLGYRVTVGSAPNLPPSAAFVPRRCTVSLPCHFTDRSSDPDGSIAGRSWDFGNGATSNEASPSITYDNEGNYPVTLWVTDDAGDSASTVKDVQVSAISNSVPVADFAVPECETGRVCHFHDGSSDADGSVVEWSWDFGNGATSSAADPSSSFAAAGTFDVTLTVTDDAGETASVTKVVTITARPNLSPTAAFAIVTCVVDVECRFTDSSSDSDGGIASWTWDFGDATSATTANPSHRFTAAGSYAVTLAVTDDAGGADTVTQDVVVTLPPNRPPSAGFSVAACTAAAPCQFTDGSNDTDGRITGRTWDFGNGASSAVANPATTYSVAGTYAVTLTVTDDAGSTGSITQSVVVSPAMNRSPVAAFTVPSCAAGKVCQFRDGSSDPDGTVAEWSWQFGNGGTSATKDPSTTYTASGSYTISLRVTDNGGSSAVITKPIAVAAAPPVSSVTLKLSGTVTDNRQYVLLTWSGLSGPSVDIYRDGSRLTTTGNDGRQNTVIPLKGKASYVYKVCEAGKSRCSASLTFTLPSVLLNVTAWMKEPGLQAMTLQWAGAAGGMVDIFRNAIRITSVANTGRYTNTRRFSGSATYVFKVCLSGTTKCSNTATATF